jgi:hypothetical protein
VESLLSNTIAQTGATDKYEIVTAKPAISDVFHICDLQLSCSATNHVCDASRAKSQRAPGHFVPAPRVDRLSLIATPKARIATPYRAAVAL